MSRHRREFKWTEVRCRCGHARLLPKHLFALAPCPHAPLLFALARALGRSSQDEAHEKMSRSTKSWLLYLTLLEAAVLVAVSLWQVSAV